MRPEQGVLFRSGEALERLAEIAAIRFDKTGTLTTGSAAVSHFVDDSSDSPETTLARAAALAAVSIHPMSRAIVEFAASRSGRDEPRDLGHSRRRRASGVIGTLSPAGLPIVLGSRRFAQEQKLAIGPLLAAEIEDAESRGLPLALIGWGARARGLFVFEEEWRPAAVAVLRCLAWRNLDVAVLTGDHAGRGRVIEQQLGVKVEAELLPAQKVAAIEKAKKAIGPVCMVGDGINDSPALAASDVGIALGCGADVSRDSASVCLLGDDLSRIPWCIELARRTRRVIRWNLHLGVRVQQRGRRLRGRGLAQPGPGRILDGGQQCAGDHQLAAAGSTIRGRVTRAGRRAAHAAVDARGFGCADLD